MPKKFFNVNNMKNFDRVTSFSKVDINCIIPEPSRVDFPCILQLTTFICQLMVFMAHALGYEELTRKLELTEIFRFISKIFSVGKYSPLSFLHLNFTIANSFFFKRWQACKSSGLTLCLVNESALQMFSSSSSSLIDGGTGFTSNDSRQ